MCDICFVGTPEVSSDSGTSDGVPALAAVAADLVSCCDQEASKEAAAELAQALLPRQGLYPPVYDPLEKGVLSAPFLPFWILPFNLSSSMLRGLQCQAFQKAKEGFKSHDRSKLHMDIAFDCLCSAVRPILRSKQAALSLLLTNIPFSYALVLLQPAPCLPDWWTPSLARESLCLAISCWGSLPWQTLRVAVSMSRA